MDPRRRTARRSRVVVLGALCILVLNGSIAAPARASATCSFASGVASVSIAGAGAAARLLVGTGGAVGQILFAADDAAPAPCGAATVTNTDLVAVTGGPDRQLVRIGLAAGPFAPGATSEASGGSEIEFSVDLGDGEDELAVSGGSDADHVTAGSEGLNLNAGESPDDVDVSVTGVERLTLEGNAGADTLSGSGGEGTGAAVAWARLSLRGGAGDDALTGGTAPDVLNGGEGQDALDGADGIDTVSYFGAPAGVTVSLAAGTASGGHGADTLVRLENVTGSAFADVLTGDEGNNALIGLAGDDVLDGLGGIDAARYLLSPAAVSVDLSAGTATGGDGNDALRGIENVLGSAFDDALTGDEGNNHLFGGAGADVLSGGGGRDLLQGGSEDDRIRGGSGNDGLFGQGGDDALRGGPGNDGLRGGAGNDEMRGGTGDDTLRGGAGADSCNGGAGRDRARSCES